MSKDVRMKFSEVKDLWNALEAILEMKQAKFGMRFSFLVLYNRKLLAPIVEPLAEMAKPVPGWPAYQREREELAKSHAVREKDQFVLVPIDGGKMAYKIDDQAAFDSALAELDKAYSAVIAEAERHEKEVLAFLDTEASVTIMTFQIEELPDMLPIGITQGLFIAIEEPATEVTSQTE